MSQTDTRSMPRHARDTEPPAAGDPFTDRTRRVWSAGEYDRIATGFRSEAEALVARLALRPEQQVLDAACGSGNVAIPAARSGALVTGVDVVPALLDVARDWSTREGLPVVLREGNVEQLPFGDAWFDVVVSMFGVMFAARPERVVAELLRVTRPGGRVVLANWTRSGFIGRMLAMHAARVPPPAGIPSPLLWGDEAVLQERFASEHWRMTTSTRTLTFRYPFTPAGTAELFRTSYGPSVCTFAALDPDQRAEFGAELAEHWWRHQKPGHATTEVDAEYREVTLTRR